MDKEELINWSMEELQTVAGLFLGIEDNSDISERYINMIRKDTGMSKEDIISNCKLGLKDLEAEIDKRNKFSNYQTI